MNFGSKPPSGAGERSPARTYAWFCALFLLLQGASTLAARLFPAVDRAIPLLLASTRMVPRHSVLHIATALLAFAALAIGARGAWWFAVLFGSFYAALGAIGAIGAIDASGLPGGGRAEDLCGVTAALGLQAFDHPFHVLLGLLGILAAWRTPRRIEIEAERPTSTLPTFSAEEP